MDPEAETSTAHFECKVVKDGPFVCLPTVSTSNSHGAPVLEVFRIEVVAIIGDSECVAMRWYAAHDAVVGIQKNQLARTMCWHMRTRENVEQQKTFMGAAEARAAKAAEVQAAQKEAVNYFYELLATREELMAGSLHVDEAFWSPEHFIRCWLRGTGQRALSVSPIADRVVERILPQMMRLRQYSIIRPYGVPEMALVEAAPVAQPAVIGERRAAGQPKDQTVGHLGVSHLRLLSASALSPSAAPSVPATAEKPEEMPDRDAEVAAEEHEACVILATFRSPQPHIKVSFGGEDGYVLEASTSSGMGSGSDSDTGSGSSSSDESDHGASSGTGSGSDGDRISSDSDSDSDRQ
eukprot:m51a1_g7188 hypothetical protein (351) ;mRNA; f:112508-113725